MNIKGSNNFPKISGSRVVWINDYYTDIVGDLITVYEKNLITGSLVTINVQHGSGQYYPMAAISGVNVVWTAWNEGMYVYWKNVLTGTGGRIVTPNYIDNLLNSSVKPSSVEKLIEQPTQVSAANTIEMQKTGTPIAGIVLALLMVLGGFIIPEKKHIFPI